MSIVILNISNHLACELQRNMETLDNLVNVSDVKSYYFEILISLREDWASTYYCTSKHIINKAVIINVDLPIILD